MNPPEDARRNVYQHILKAANKRLEQGTPGSEGAFAQLSLASLLNILFLLQGQWGIDWGLRDNTKGYPSACRG